MFMHLAEAIQSAPQHGFHLLVIKLRELVLNAHSHAIRDFFVKLRTPAHLLRQGGTSRPPHLVGVDRIGQGFDVFLHASRLAKAGPFVKCSVV